MVGNIPGNNVSEGEELSSYLQPFPPRGVGFQRLVFLLFKQSDGKIDYSNTLSRNDSILKNRTFKCSDFYRRYEENLTPASVQFFQCDWDNSVTSVFHNKLNIKEPCFEYDWEPPHLAKQEWFPYHKYFPEYLDLYRDKKELAAEVLVKKLSKTHPFKKPEEEFPYPDSLQIPPDVPTWKKFQIHKERNKEGKYKDS